METGLICRKCIFKLKQKGAQRTSVWCRFMPQNSSNCVLLLGNIKTETGFQQGLLHMHKHILKINNYSLFIKSMSSVLYAVCWKMHGQASLPAPVSREKHTSVVTLEVLKIMHLVCHTFWTFCESSIPQDLLCCQPVCVSSILGLRWLTEKIPHICMCPIYVNDTVLMMKLLPLRQTITALGCNSFFLLLLRQKSCCAQS